MTTVPTFDARRRANSYMADLSMSQVTLCALVDMPASRLNLQLRYKIQFSPEDEKNVIDTLLRLIELRDAFTPLVLDWDSPDFCKMLLKSGVDAEIVRLGVESIFRERS